MKTTKLFGILLLFFSAIHFVGCGGDEDDYDLPPISQTAGDYVGHYTVYKNDIKTDTGDGTVKVDLVFDEIHPIVLQSSDLTVESRKVTLHAPCYAVKKENVYSLSEEQMLTLPGVTGFKEYKAVITGKLDGRTLEFKADLAVEDVNPPYQVKIRFQGRK